MTELLQKIESAAGYLRGRFPGFACDTALVLGSGWGPVADSLTDGRSVDYKEIPRWPVSTVTGHSGKFLYGKWGGIPLTILQGRSHVYEGRTVQDVAFPIRVLTVLGIRNLILTNAAGALNPEFRPGDIMIHSAHIKALSA